MMEKTRGQQGDHREGCLGATRAPEGALSTTVEALGRTLRQQFLSNCDKVLRELWAKLSCGGPWAVCV